MDVIIIGLYSIVDVHKINNMLRTSDKLKIIWNHTEYNLESEEGIKEMEHFFKLYKTGIVLSKGDELVSSYSLISEISTYYEVTKWQQKEYANPSLFSFFEQLNQAKVERFVIAFADEWSKDTTVKIEKIEIKRLSQRLNSFYVWCEGYRNLVTNSEIRDDYHPLILDVGPFSK